MSGGLIPISAFDLALSGIFILLVLALSLYEQLRLEREFIIASLRTVVQLLLGGYIIQYIFAANRWYWVMLALAVMLGVACQAGLGRLQTRGRDLWWMMALSLTIGNLFTLFLVTGVILRVSPWFNPRYLIPLAGMIIANGMNGATLAAERLRSDLMSLEAEVETLLCLGFEARRAAHLPRLQALRAALMPTLNSMMVVGIVALPGMMTGQILSGTSPLQAVRYQIIVMLMIAGTVTLCALVMVRLLMSRYFSRDHQFNKYLLR